MTQDMETVLRMSFESAAARAPIDHDFLLRQARAGARIQQRRTCLTSIAGAGVALAVCAAGVVLLPLARPSQNEPVIVTAANSSAVSSSPSVAALPPPRLIEGTWDKHQGGGMLALIRTNLRVMSSGCVVGTSDMGGTAALIWPKGYTVRRDSSGRAVVFNEAARPVAREGDKISAGGGQVHPVGDPCEEGTGETFMIQDDLPERP